MRKKARKDLNHNRITNHLSYLRKKGYPITYQDTHQIGDGFPDIVVGFCGINFLFEIKRKKGKLTKAEENYIDNWGGLIIVIKSTESLLSYLYSYFVNYYGDETIAKNYEMVSEMSGALYAKFSYEEITESE